MIRLTDLVVMQHQLRDINQIGVMIEFVKEGNLWTADAIKKHNPKGSIIYISRFPDQQLMIHDGHHRCVATYLSGRQVLHPEEFEIHNWTYEDYNTINWERGYITPHDPRTEVRKPDLRAFKNSTHAIANKLSIEQAEQWIVGCRLAYCEPRRFYTLAELAKQWEIERSEKWNVTEIGAQKKPHEAALP